MNRTLLIAILASLAMVGPLGIDTYLPSFSALAATYSTSPAVVQQTLSVFVFCFALMMLFYGTLSDSFGRRPVLLISLSIFSLANLAAMFAPSIGALIAIRAVQGLAGGAGSVVGRAIIQDRFKGAEAQRAMAQVMMVFGLAPAIAPVIGGWLQHALGWRAVFGFLALSGAALVAACYFGLQESLPREKFQPFGLRSVSANYWRALSDTRFLLMCVSIALVFCGIPLYVGSAAHFVMDILHLPETAFAWLFVPLIGGIIVGSALVSRLSKEGSAGRLIPFGLSLALVGTCSSVAYTHYAAVVEIPYAVMPLALYTFGMAIASPGMTVLAMERFPEMRGLASSMQGFLQMMLFALVTGVVAPLLFGSPEKLALGHLTGVLLGIALWLLSRSGVVAAMPASARAQA